MPDIDMIESRIINLGSDLSAICARLEPMDRERLRAAIALGLAIGLIQNVSSLNDLWVISLASQPFPFTLSQSEFVGFCMGIHATVTHAQLTCSDNLAVA